MKRKTKCGHWISTLRNPEGEIWFMDSFGENPNHYQKNIIPCYKNNGIKKLSINNSELQCDEAMTCGRYAILFTCTP